MNIRTVFWTSSEIDGVGLMRILESGSAAATRSGADKTGAFSVRLIKEK